METKWARFCRLKLVGKEFAADSLRRTPKLPVRRWKSTTKMADTNR